MRRGYLFEALDFLMLFAAVNEETENRPLSPGKFPATNSFPVVIRISVVGTDVLFVNGDIIDIAEDFKKFPACFALLLFGQLGKLSDTVTC